MQINLIEHNKNSHNKNDMNYYFQISSKYNYNNI